jgi:uncharacterized protein involved in exopolysaccharide biosynthesis
MKRKISYIISSLLIAGSIIIPSVAVAHAEDTTSGSSGSGSTTTTTSTDDTTKVETENHTMEDRITKFKTDFKVKLATAEAARIKLKCVGAQGVVGTLNTKFGNSITVRTQAYTELQKNLDKLVTRLKAKNVDTTTLESQITELKAKITTYTTDLTAYKQALTDLKAVDCKTDPDGFQAALLAARSAHDKLVTDVTAIRTYLTGTIKPTLQTIKQQLAAKDSSSSSNEGSN